MRKQGALLSALLLLGTMPRFQQKGQPAKQPIPQATQEVGSTPIVIPPDAAKKVNPVKPTEESIAAGKRRFGFECALCHGIAGDGKGDVAKSMSLKPPDFRNPDALKSVTDGGLYYVISKGHDAMPSEESRTQPEDIWNLVNYVRSLAANKQPAKSK
ncbi:MAG TPA: cytochrome c [Candidatus Acidoferrales bacterium]|nr:cytochrome c [Candidatus Acidoferrales bacterium]